MRPTAVLLALALAVLLAPAASAQPPTFTEPYQVRVAQGDIATTPAAEPANAWNVEQLLAVTFDPAATAEASTYRFNLPAGSSLLNVTCDCAFTRSQTGATLAVTLVAPTTAGTHTLRVGTTQPATDAFGLRLQPPMPVDGVVVLYAPTGTHADSTLELSEVGQATNGQSTIHYARFGPVLPSGSAVAIVPGAPQTDAADPVEGRAGWSAWLVPVLVGLVLGALLWALLVSKGIVQARSRKQVAATAAHVEAASTDPPAVLEGKKRALLAALKEVELAKQANEMPVEVYDAVKADLKKQAVTVMRALETSGDQPKA